MARSATLSTIPVPAAHIVNTAISVPIFDALVRRQRASKMLTLQKTARTAVRDTLVAAKRTSIDASLDIGADPTGTKRGRVYVSKTTRHTSEGLKFVDGAATRRLYTDHRHIFDTFFEADEDRLSNLYIGPTGAQRRSIGAVLDLVGETVTLPSDEAYVDPADYSSMAEWERWMPARLLRLRDSSASTKAAYTSAGEDLAGMIAECWDALAARYVAEVAAHNQMAVSKNWGSKVMIANPPADAAAVGSIVLRLDVPDLETSVDLKLNRGLIGNAAALRSRDFGGFAHLHPEMSAEYLEVTPARDTEVSQLQILWWKDPSAAPERDTAFDDVAE